MTSVVSNEQLKSSEQNVTDYMVQVGQQARQAARAIAKASVDAKNNALELIAKSLPGLQIFLIRRF